MSWKNNKWVDDDGSLTVGTPFDAEHMNNIELGIAEGMNEALAASGIAGSALTKAASGVTAAGSALTTAQAAGSLAGSALATGQQANALAASGVTAAGSALVTGQAAGMLAGSALVTAQQANIRAASGVTAAGSALVTGQFAGAQAASGITSAGSALVTAQRANARTSELFPEGLILVRAATTNKLPTNTVPVTNVLEASANGALPEQDGVSLTAGDRLLVRNEVVAARNGPYEVVSPGSEGSKWVLARLSTFNESSKVIGGMQFNVLQGTFFGGLTLRLTNVGVITLNTTALIFEYAGEWVAATMLNSWAKRETEGFAGPAFRKAPDNHVTIRGLVEHTGSLAAESNMFTLPAGFRPSGHLLFPTAINNGAGAALARIKVSTTGEVLYLPSATSVVASLPFNFSFYAD